MMNGRITVFRAACGFMTEPDPLWVKEIQRIAGEGRDWDAAVRAVLNNPFSHVVVGDDYWPYGELRAYLVPGGGRYVELSEAEGSFVEVWVPNPADWLDFNVRYIEPFLLTRATLYQADRINRLGNALTAFVRHGQGRHIDRDTGESRIDQREDWERRKREDLVFRATKSPAA